MKNFFSTLVLGVSVISLAVSAHADNKLYTSLGLGYAAPEDMPKASTFDEIFGVIPAGTSGRTDDNYGGRIAQGGWIHGPESIAPQQRASEQFRS